MRTKIDNLDRINLFNHYNNETNPFLYVTTKIDITNIHKNCKYYYPSIAFFLHKALEKIDNFKYRCEDNNIYYYDNLRLNFTEKKDDGNIGFFDVENIENYNDFMKEYQLKKEKLLNGEKLELNKDQGEIWYSCNPWFNITQLLTPFNKSIAIPQIMWDKFMFENGKVYVNLTIMVHHGFVDGFHLGEFIKKFEEIENNINDYI